MNSACVAAEKTRSKHEIARKVLLTWALVAVAGLIFTPYMVYTMLNSMPNEVVVFMCFYSVCPTLGSVWLYSIIFFSVVFGPPALLSVVIAAFLDLLARRKK